MNLTSIEIVKIIMLVIYAMSLFVYLRELLEDLKDNRPKVFSEWFWYVAILIGAFVPALNTIVCYQIIKKHKEYEQ
tara:strand:+ start:199 stop:426 length:228 start_codon:yes stop_codon:yes gene_type:complete